MFESSWFGALAIGAAWIALFMLVFLAARWIRELATSYDTHEQVITHDNVAVAIALAGYYIGVIIIFIGAYLGPAETLLDDLLTVGGYSLLGILLLNVARLVTDKLVLHAFSVRKELIEDRNTGTGVVMFATYVAAGLIVAGAVHGEGGSIWTALAFFVLGQAALVLFTFVYEFTTPYALHAEIEADNVSAGVGFSGALIAIALIVMNAIEGDFVSWSSNLTTLGIEVAAVFAFLVLVRLFFDKVLLPGAELNQEIARDRNLGAGILEFAISVGFAAVLVVLV